MKNSWFTRGDLDGFFGLFIDNLLQLMVISVLGRAVCGFPPELINGRILPGAALSILVGNLFYAWQARIQGVLPSSFFNASIKTPSTDGATFEEAGLVS